MHAPDAKTNGTSKAPITILLDSSAGRAGLLATASAVGCVTLLALICGVRGFQREGTGPMLMVVNHYYGCIVLVCGLVVGPLIVTIVGVAQLCSPGGDVKTAVGLAGGGLLLTLAAVGVTGHRTWAIDSMNQRIVVTRRWFLAFPRRVVIPIEAVDCFVLKSSMRRGKPMTQIRARLYAGGEVRMEANWSTRDRRDRMSLCNRMNSFLGTARHRSSADTTSSWIGEMVDPTMGLADGPAYEGNDLADPLLHTAEGSSRPSLAESGTDDSGLSAAEGSAAIYPTGDEGPRSRSRGPDTEDAM